MQKTLVVGTLDIDLVATYEQGFTLAVTSTPINVTFTMNAQSLSTPFNQTLLTGAYTIVMPTAVGNYRFKQWNDGSTDPSKTINLATDTSLTATYELVAVTHNLTVNSSPSGVLVTVDGSSYTTPRTLTLAEETHTIVVPASVTVGSDTYNFKQWEDASTNPTRTVNLTADMTIVATYELYVPPPTKYNLVVTSTPISVALTVDGYQYTTPTQPLNLQAGTHTIVAPSNALADSDIYNFKHWEDGSTNPTRTLNLIADITITCTYELQPPPPPAKGNIEIHAYYGGAEIMTPFEIVGVTTGNTPATVEVNVGTYTVKVTFEGVTKTETVGVVEQQTVRKDYQFVPTAVPEFPIWGIILVGGVIGGGVLYALSKRKK